MWRRLIGAIVLIGCCFAALWLVEFGFDELSADSGDPAVETSASDAQSAAAIDLSSDDPLWEAQSFLDALEDDSWTRMLTEEAPASMLPPRFEEELFPVSSFEAFRSAGGGRILGFVAPGSAERCFSELAKNLESRGWILMESGQEGRASFIKSEGRYRWIYLSCDEIAGDCSVLVVLDQDLSLSPDKEGDAHP